jgi:NAD(P)H-hydrate epimerase
VIICCGKGNNGGDGFVVARHLDLRGVGVRVLVWAEANDLSGDAGANFGILQKSGVPLEVFGGRHDPTRLAEQLNGAQWVVDALLGTGAKGPPRPPIDAVIEQLNASGVPIVAIDLPSGLDCDTGEAAEPTIRARHTCTFVAAKPGFFLPRAEAYTGQVHVLDIGAPRQLIESIV